ncbi:S41 family peptidase [Nesterenkonia muleiensis]|uniref:S41 family peptidase n=1 Tax=Nesterenkonia muleiensis TaxID=2282648 RepID=UPI000E7264D1|nr:S41 family peptidase [Nesterenkonia muleiensis]
MIPAFDRPVRLEWDVPGLERLLPLLRLERHEFAAVLGQPVEITAPGRQDHHVWQIHLDAQSGPPRLQADMRRRTVTSVLPHLESFADTLNLLHTLAHSPQDEVASQEAESYGEVAERIFREIANSYPSFGLRELDWQAISARYADVGLLEGGAFWKQARRWVAELGDAHSAIIPPGPRHHPPYIVEMTSMGARLLDVPEHSAAYVSGVRDGWTIPTEESAYWLEVTGASPQHWEMIAARRFMEMTTVPSRFTAQSPGGEKTSWDEPAPDAEPSVRGSAAAIRISRFDSRTPELLAGELSARQDQSEITIDLRGNVGGSLVAADQCRRMLIREAGEHGTIRYSDGRGGFSASYPICLEPDDVEFHGQVRVLVDAMTYSAAEDFLQPLAWLGHVRVEGGPTGGGSGRPRTVPLKDGYTLRVSTAITYTPDGQPIEYQGIGG